jgi:hypothetical protein
MITYSEKKRNDLSKKGVRTMSFLDALKRKNTILNTKGGEYYSTTWNANLDVFAGLSRFNDTDEIIRKSTETQQSIVTEKKSIPLSIDIIQGTMTQDEIHQLEKEEKEENDSRKRIKESTEKPKKKRIQPEQVESIPTISIPFPTISEVDKIITEPLLSSGIISFELL